MAGKSVLSLAKASLCIRDPFVSCGDSPPVFGHRVLDLPSTLRISCELQKEAKMSTYRQERGWTSTALRLRVLFTKLQGLIIFDPEPRAVECFLSYLTYNHAGNVSLFSFYHVWRIILDHNASKSMLSFPNETPKVEAIRAMILHIV
jgi:hypothetical protein